MTNLDDLTILEQTERYVGYALDCAHTSTGTTGATGAGRTLRIAGRLYVPAELIDGTKPDVTFPTVIISHGFNDTYDHTSEHARYLASRGIVSYVYDFCGGSVRSHSDGDMLDMSVNTEQTDLQAVASRIRELPFVDRRRLFLMGCSQGGMVSAMEGADHPRDYAGMVLFYPAFVIPDDARKRCGTHGSIPQTSAALGTPVGRAYNEAVVDMDIYQRIAGFDNPVLIVHGDVDGIVPIAYSQRARDQYANAELLTIPGAGHGFSGTDFTTACNAAATFVLNATALAE